ncbi:UDP-N-acetylmuramoylalanine--D-glutamate ligase [Lachnospiraceae bacterium RM5]|nr:UDP-N-acetylmuramoylalanine--D-glutamate ligase [Lachnospiraceae bacterium RM5]
MRYLVVGTGKSGIGSAKLLLRHNEEVVIYDSNENIDVDEVKNKLGKDDVKIILGKLDNDDFKDIDIMVISPGVPIDADFVIDAKKAGVHIWGEIELAFRYAKGRIIGITGTNGKTTTTTLVGEIMKNYFDSVFVVGNIGYPFTDIVDETKDDSVIVAEISSFQLESIDEFHPVLTSVLNITPDHLNRHYTMENYADVKMSITKNQTEEEVCVLNYEDEILRKYAGKLPAKVMFFSSASYLDKGVFLDGERIIYREHNVDECVCKVSEMKLVGMHNVENVMAAICMSISMGVDIETIRNTIREFKAVEHRIEFVRDLDDVLYYNDSKGTNTDASIKAIEAMTRPTVLIAGGYDKGSEYDDWIKAFNGKIKKLVLIGDTKDKIAQCANKYGYRDYIFATDLKDAVEKCKENVGPGDAVLLSPACASWDMFKSYEERGDLFKEYVNAL